MKKTILLLTLGLLSCAITSCEKNELKNAVDYTPGEIPGLGDAEGELTGTPFGLPRGIELIDEITGNSSQSGYWTLDYSVQRIPFKMKDGSVVTRSTAETTYSTSRHFYGSGYGYVDLLIPMRNTTGNSITVTFPAALILRNESGSCQNGVLIKKVDVEIPAGEDYYLNLAFYCGNAHKSSAGSNDIYSLGVVSDALPLLELCDKVKNKKINLEDFDYRSSEDYYTYKSQTDILQDIVWEVTDGEGLTSEEIAYIESLPECR